MNSKIEPFDHSHSKKISSFIKKVFDSHVGPSYSQNGRSEFYKYIEPEAISERQLNNHIMLVKKEGNEIVGIVEMRNLNHISMLFIETDQQRMGYGHSLINEAIALCKANSLGIKEITVNSSPNATAAYEKFGFKIEADEKETNGIRYVPMKLSL